LTTRLHSLQDAAEWLKARVVGDLKSDSRQVRAGDGFVAWPGAAVDARQYLSEALDGGARACLVEAFGVSEFGFEDSRIACYLGLKTAAAPIAAAYYSDPSRQLQTVAITGTNGKTSTAWWLANALKSLGTKCGVVGTLGMGEPSAMVLTGMTTPDPVSLQKQFRQFVDHEFSVCALEASSIGIAEHRLDATHIQVAVFTNFTQDHLDYHPSMSHYWAAKESLFAWPGLKSAVINIDDEKGAVLADKLASEGRDVWSVSIVRRARLEARNIQQGSHSIIFDLAEGDEKHTVAAETVGLYNVSNLLCVVGSLRALGISLKDAAQSCVGLPAVPGRLNSLVVAGAPLVVIDYAHTPDALEKVLLALQPVTSKRNGKLWCVFGCGGDRDAGKRPLMGAVAQKNATRVVVTSDNPRTENIDTIIGQIRSGFTSPATAQVEPDRAKAIAQTITLADAKDVILIAGKGHEDYQEISGIKYPFVDADHARIALASRVASSTAAVLPC
jgi:UDP-N-acetylmuramyl-tripeptide synthetase